MKAGPRIKVTKDGPYEVHNIDRIMRYQIIPDDEGASEEYRADRKYDVAQNPVYVCRCGRTHRAPFCDGSHAAAGWDGEESAGFAPLEDGAEYFEGPNLRLADNPKFCAYARFCDAKGRVWNLINVGNDRADKQAIREAMFCPAGRLVMYDKESGEAYEPEYEPEVAVLEDPVIEASGPVFVKGGIEVESASGRSYEVRNRQTLCRCGRSHNKPFCDGSHAAQPVFKAAGEGENSEA